MRRYRSFIPLLAGLLILTVVVLSLPIQDLLPPDHRPSYAKKDCSELAQALAYYEAEYQRPLVTGATKTESGDSLILTDGTNPLISILVADDQCPTTSKENPRGVYFLSVRPARTLNGHGIYRNIETGLLRMNDPWGHPLRILLDTNDDGSLQVSQDFHTLYGRYPVRICCWSMGPDGAEAQLNAKQKNDDIYGTAWR